MVVRFQITMLLLCLLALNQHVAAATLSVHLSNTQVELGKYASLVLHSDKLLPSLRSVDLTALQENFFVDDTAEISTQNQTQQWLLRLYPRHSGNPGIPELRYENSTSPGLPLVVTPAIDAKTGHRLMIKSSLSSNNLWLNQQALITLIVTSKDPHVVLEATEASLASGKLHSTGLHTVQNAETGLASHRIGWAYFPTRAGAQILHLPPIYYKRDGVITHRFYLPLQRLQVKPLPVYVPANFPVGELQLQVSLPASILLSNTLQTLNLNFQATGIAQEHIPRLENYLHGDAGLQLYPAEASYTQVTTANGLTSRIQLQLPVKATQSGLFHLEDIAIQYFEPTSGKLQTLRYRWQTLLFVSPWLLIVVASLGVFLLGYGLLKIFNYGKACFQQYQYWYLARKIIHDAVSPQEIKVAIMLISKAQQGSDNTTLQRWVTRNGDDTDTEPLSLALYADARYDLQKLKQPYLQLFNKKLRFKF